MAWCSVLSYLNTESLTASAQCVIGSVVQCSAYLAQFMSVPLILSAIYFCWGVCGSVVMSMTLRDRYMGFACTDTCSLALSA